MATGQEAIGLMGAEGDEIAEAGAEAVAQGEIVAQEAAVEIAAIARNNY